MKPYDQLTFRGKIRRLRQVALKALEHYPIEVKRVRYLTTESTTMFRVDATDGRKYVLRLYSELDSSLAENETEMFWLNALARDTDLRVVRPVPRTDGAYISFVRIDGLPVEKRCALYEWVPGGQMAGQINPHNYHQLGAFMAALHNHAGSLTLPGHIRPKRWDRVFYFPDEPVVYDTPEYAHLFTPGQLEIMRRAHQRLDAFLEDLYARGGAPMLVHADLHFWNVHVSRGDLYVIDFEDIILGYPLHDIAISLYYLRGRADYPELAAAFRAGYATRRSWPDFTKSDFELLWAARMTNFINYVAHVDEAEEAREFFDTRFLELGKLLNG